MTDAPQPRICAADGCGAVLSSYNDDPEGLCAPCRRRAEQDRVDASARDGIDLERLVAGLLLTHDALNPGEPLNIGRDLAAIGVECDSFAVQTAVRHAERRHGIVCRGVKGRPGYRVVCWEVRYKPVRGRLVIPRDESGKWVLPSFAPTIVS